VFDLHVEGEAEVRRSVMDTRKYRTVVAAVLVGVVLCSPLLCGMSCLENHVIRASVAGEIASPVEELVMEFARSVLVGCVLTNVVSKIDFSEWTGQVDVMTWVWVGMEVLRLSDEAWRVELVWM
jgi:hypothetical protein